MRGNLPDAEEPEDVVDAEGVEVFGHLGHACPPPGVAVACHAFPVVSRESPVLPDGRECVGRSPGLRVHVEQVRVEPCVDARAADADGQVALEDDAVVAGVGADLGQLRMQVVLDIAVECDVAAVAAAIGVDGFAVIAGETAPAGEVGRARFVAQRAEGGIGDEPVSVGGDEVLVVAACCSAGSVAFERPAEQPQFVPVDPFVVYFGEGVQFVAQGAVLVVLHDARGRQPDELRVQGEGRIGVVGVGVFPCAGHGGIVDRQYLDDALPGGGRPVDEPFQVVELADAEILFRTEREDRDRHSGAPPPALGEPRVRRGVEGVFAGAGQLAPGAVGTLLPQDGGEGLAVGDQEFVFEPVCGMQREFPFREAAVVHRDDPFPVAQFTAAAGDGERFVRPQGGQHDAQRDVAGRFLRIAGFSAAEDAPGECRGVERRVGGHLLPAVADAQRAHPLPGREPQRVRPPFAADACAVAFDFIAVFGIIPLGIAVDGACPDASVGVLQRNAPFADPHDELFAPAGTVFDADQEFHGSVCRLVRNRFIQN